MAGSRRGTADWHFATGHFGRKRAIRRRGGGGTPAVGTGAGRRRGCTGGDAGVPAAKRRGGSRKGKTPADGTGPADRAAEEELQLRAQGGSAERRRRCGRRRRCTGRWHGAGRQGDRGGTPAAGTRRVGGTAEEVRAAEEEFRLRAQGGSAERRRRCGRWHAGQRHKKGLRYRRPVSGGPDYIYYRFCSPRIRIATSRIVVSSNVTTPPSGPGSK